MISHIVCEEIPYSATRWW